MAISYLSATTSLSASVNLSSSASTFAKFRVNERQYDDPYLCRQLAELNNPEAQFRTGYRLDYGVQGIAPNYPEAIEWYRKAATQNHSKAKQYLSRLELLLELQQKGEQGQMSAQFQVGSIYCDQRHDYPQAVRWYERACSQQHLVALYRLSQLYRFGKGEVIPRDAPKAAQLCRQAAERNYAAAQLAMGQMCEDGDGLLERDVEQAREWYLRAAQQNFPGAQEAADHPFLNQAITLKRRVRQGEGQAAFELGYHYYSKDDERRSWDPDIQREAHKWFSLAALQHQHLEAEFYLGAMAQEGRGTGQDITEALKRFRSAAERGHGQAAFVLGLMFETGRAVGYLDPSVFATASALSSSEPNSSASCSGSGVQDSMEGDDDADIPMPPVAPSALASPEPSTPSNSSASTPSLHDFGIDEKKALFWYRKAAASGFERAFIKIDELEVDNCSFGESSSSEPLPSLTAIRRNYADEQVTWTLSTEGSSASTGHIIRYSTKVSGGEEKEKLLVCSTLTGSFVRDRHHATLYRVHWTKEMRTETGPSVGGFRKTDRVVDARDTIWVEFGIVGLQYVTAAPNYDIAYDEYPIVGHPPLTPDQQAQKDLRLSRKARALAVRRARELTEAEALRLELEALEAAQRAAEEAAAALALANENFDDLSTDIDSDDDEETKQRKLRKQKQVKIIDGDEEEVKYKKKKKKVKFTFRPNVLPVPVWLNLISFLPAFYDIKFMAIWSKAFHKFVHETLQARRASFKLRKLDAEMLDDAFDHMGMYCADHMKQVVLHDCAHLNDMHLDTLSMSVTALTSLSIDACPSITDDGLLPVLNIHSSTMKSVALRHLCSNQGVSMLPLNVLVDGWQLAERTPFSLTPMSSQPGSVNSTARSSIPPSAQRYLSSRSNSARGANLQNLENLLSATRRRAPVLDRVPVEELELIDIPDSMIDAELCARMMQALPSVKSNPNVKSIKLLKMERGTEPTGLVGADFVSDAALQALHHATKLESLSVAGMCQWTPAVMGALLRRLPNLAALDISRCTQVNDIVISTLTYSLGHHLRRFFIAGCHGITDACLAIIAKNCPKLEVLDLSFDFTLSAAAIQKFRYTSKARVLLRAYESATPRILQPMVFKALKKRKFSLKFGMLTPQLWRRVLDFLPQFFEIRVLARLNRVFRHSIFDRLLTLRNKAQLNAYDDDKKLTAALDHLGLWCADSLHSLTLANCAAFKDHECDFVQGTFNSLQSLEIENCTNISNEGLIPLLTANMMTLRTLGLRRFMQAKSLDSLPLITMCDLLEAGYSPNLPEVATAAASSAMLSVSSPFSLHLESQSQAPAKLSKAGSKAAPLQGLHLVELPESMISIELAYRLLSALPTISANSSVLSLKELRLEAKTDQTEGDKIGSGFDFVTDDTIQLLKRAKRLEFLSLAGTSKWTPSVLIDLLQKLPKFKAIDLSRCPQVSDAFILTLIKAVGRSLRSIRLAGCKITDKSMTAIARGCKRLQTLDVSFISTITKESVASFKRISNTAQLIRLAEVAKVDKAKAKSMAEKRAAALAIQEAAGVLGKKKKDKKKYIVSFQTLPPKAWCHVLEFLPFFTELTVVPLLSKAFSEGIKDLIPLRSGLELFHLKSSARLDEVWEYVGLWCAQSMKRVQLLNCPKLNDLHLDTISMNLSHLTHLSIDACASITNDGLIPIFGSRHAFTLQSLRLRHLAECLNVSDAPLSVMLDTWLAGSLPSIASSWQGTPRLDENGQFSPPTDVTLTADSINIIASGDCSIQNVTVVDDKQDQTSSKQASRVITARSSDKDHLLRLSDISSEPSNSAAFASAIASLSARSDAIIRSSRAAAQAVTSRSVSVSASRQHSARQRINRVSVSGTASSLHSARTHAMDLGESTVNEFGEPLLDLEQLEQALDANAFIEEEAQLPTPRKPRIQPALQDLHLVDVPAQMMTAGLVRELMKALTATDLDPLTSPMLFHQIRSIRFERDVQGGCPGCDFVTDEMLLQMKSMTNLTSLSLSGMQNWSISALLSLLRSLPHLHTLELNKCLQVNDFALTSILQITRPHLTTLLIGSAQNLTNDCFNVLYKLGDDLDMVDLSFNFQLTAEAITKFRKVTKHTSILLRAYDSDLPKILPPITPPPPPPKRKFALRFDLLPVKIWLFLLEFMPQLAELFVFSRLSNSFRENFAEHILPKRRVLRLKDVKDVSKIDAYVDHITLYCGPRLRDLRFFKCSALKDSHLDVINLSITQIRTLILDYCTSITGASLTPLLNHQANAFKKLVLRGLSSEQNMTDQVLDALADSWQAATDPYADLDDDEMPQITDLVISDVCASMTSESTMVRLLRSVPSSDVRGLMAKNIRSLKLECGVGQAHFESGYDFVTDAVLEELQQFTDLYELSLQGMNQFSEASLLAVIQKIGRVSNLNLNGCQQITDATVAAIAKFIGPRLKRLNIGNCFEVTGASLLALPKSCPNLDSLDLSNLCNVSFVHIEDLKRDWPHIELINDTSPPKAPIRPAVSSFNQASASLSKSQRVKKFSLQADIFPPSVWIHLFEFISFFVELAVINRLSRSFNQLVSETVGMDRNGVLLSNLTLARQPQQLVQKLVGYNFQTVRVVKCPGMLDLQWQSLIPCCLRLRHLHIDECVGLTDRGLSAILSSRGHQLQSLHLLRLSNASKSLTNQSLIALQQAMKKTAQQFKASDSAKHSFTRTFSLYTTSTGTPALFQSSFPQSAALTSLEELFLGDLPERMVQPISLLTDLFEHSLPGSSDQPHTPALQILSLERKMLESQSTGFDFVTDELLASLRGLSRLRKLSLAGMCSWTEEALENLLTWLPSLRELDISRCSNVTDNMIEIVGCTTGAYLTFLNIAECPKLTDACVDLIAENFTALNSIDVSFNFKISAPAIQRLRESNGKVHVLMRAYAAEKPRILQPLPQKSRSLQSTRSMSSEIQFSAPLSVTQPLESEDTMATSDNLSADSTAASAEIGPEEEESAGFDASDSAESTGPLFASSDSQSVSARELISSQQSSASVIISPAPPDSPVKPFIFTYQLLPVSLWARIFDFLEFPSHALKTIPRINRSFKLGWHTELCSQWRSLRFQRRSDPDRLNDIIEWGCLNCSEGLRVISFTECSALSDHHFDMFSFSLSRLEELIIDRCLGISDDALLPLFSNHAMTLRKLHLAHLTPSHSSLSNSPLTSTPSSFTPTAVAGSFSEQPLGLLADMWDARRRRVIAAVRSSASTPRTHSSSTSSPSSARRSSDKSSKNHSGNSSVLHSSRKSSNSNSVVNMESNGVKFSLSKPSNCGNDSAGYLDALVAEVNGPSFLNQISVRTQESDSDSFVPLVDMDVEPLTELRLIDLPPEMATETIIAHLFSALPNVKTALAGQLPPKAIEILIVDRIADDASDCVNDVAVVALKDAARLHTLSLQKMTRWSADVMSSTLQCLHHLAHVNLNGCFQVTDSVVITLVRNCGSVLQSLQLSGCSLLTDRAIDAVMNHAIALRVLDVSRNFRLTASVLRKVEAWCKSQGIAFSR